jgi:type IV pilus assembly protein PilQ
MKDFGVHTMRSARSLLTVLALTATVVSVPVIAGDLNVEGLQVVAGDQPEVLIQLDDTAEGSAVSTFTLSGPDRLVIDIPDTRTNLAVSELDSDDALVDRVEITEFDDGNGYITRITLFLSRPASTVQPQVTTDGRQVRVRLETSAAIMGDPLAEAMGPETGGNAEIGSGGPALRADRDPSGPNRIAAQNSVASLDFQNLDSTSRVVIGLKGTDAYEVNQPQPNLITVDVPGAFLPQSLRRVLDTSEFLSPVRMVRAYRTGSGSRIAISLRSETTYTVGTGEGGLVYVDVVVPAQMLQDRELSQQGFQSVAPSNSDGGRMQSATGKEVLIGSDGRSMDPAAVYGVGGGAMGPNTSMGMAAGFTFDQSSASSMPFQGRRISLDFVDADIHSIFRLISHVSRLNIVSSDDVQGNVTVRMTDVPWDQALAAVLQAKGLGSQKFGNIIRVAPIETIKAEQQAALETQRAIDDMTELQLLILPLNYVQADNIREQVGEVLSERGSVQVDSTSNQLIVQETEQKLAQVRELVRNMDRQTPQVLIEARVVEANSNYARALGIQWGAEVDASTRTGYSTGLFFPNSVGASGALNTAGGTQFYEPGADSLMVDMGAEGAMSGVSFNLGSIPGLVDLDARLSAMESDGWGKVVSQPRVTTLDNRTATISQGQRIPFLSTSAGGTNVQFIEATLQLEVTPHITSDDKVFLAITVTNNRADFSQLVQGNPAIQIKEAQTELLVEDGDTTVMGGVFSTEQSFSQDTVPGLSKIPLLGYLFKNSAEATTRNELLVFITPHIVTRPTVDGG